MLSRLRKYSIAALMVFLFPQVVEAVHTYEHRNDKHCTERIAHHFHDSPHHCPICDFVPTVFDEPPHIDNILADAAYATVSFSFYKSFVVTTHNYGFSLRGPPTIS
jgi:hypothetical protein